MRRIAAVLALTVLGVFVLPAGMASAAVDAGGSVVDRPVADAVMTVTCGNADCTSAIVSTESDKDTVSGTGLRLLLMSKDPRTLPGYPNVTWTNWNATGNNTVVGTGYTYSAAEDITTASVSSYTPTTAWRYAVWIKWVGTGSLVNPARVVYDRLTPPLVLPPDTTPVATGPWAWNSVTVVDAFSVTSDRKGLFFDVHHSAYDIARYGYITGGANVKVTRSSGSVSSLTFTGSSATDGVCGVSYASIPDKDGQYGTRYTLSCSEAFTAVSLNADGGSMLSMAAPNGTSVALPPDFAIWPVRPADSTPTDPDPSPSPTPTPTDTSSPSPSPTPTDTSSPSPSPTPTDGTGGGDTGGGDTGGGDTPEETGDCGLTNLKACIADLFEVRDEDKAAMNEGLDTLKATIPFGVPFVAFGWFDDLRSSLTYCGAVGTWGNHAGGACGDILVIKFPLPGSDPLVVTWLNGDVVGVVQPYRKAMEVLVWVGMLMPMAYYAYGVVQPRLGRDG